MAGDTANARIWLLGDFYAGPVGTTGPTDTTTVLAPAFKALGLLHEDGLTEERDEDSTDHYAWGGVLVRTTRSKHKRTFVIRALEDNPVVFGLVNPGSTAATDSGVTTRTIKLPTPNPMAFVGELTDGASKSRLWVPRGEVVEVGAVERNESDMTTRDLTIAVYPSSSGVLYTEITTDPAAAVA